MIHLWRNEKGFSVLEILVATCIGTMLLMTVNSLLFTYNKSYKKSESNVDIIRTLKRLINSIEKNIEQSSGDVTPKTITVSVLNASSVPENKNGTALIFKMVSGYNEADQNKALSNYYAYVYIPTDNTGTRPDDGKVIFYKLPTTFTLDSTSIPSNAVVIEKYNNISKFEIKLKFSDSFVSGVNNEVHYLDKSVTPNVEYVKNPFICTITAQKSEKSQDKLVTVKRTEQLYCVPRSSLD